MNETREAKVVVKEEVHHKIEKEIVHHDEVDVKVVEDRGMTLGSSLGNTQIEVEVNV
jgi:hypothetical protein